MKVKAIFQRQSGVPALRPVVRIGETDVSGALKAQNTLAQGNALGNCEKKDSPERAAYDCSERDISYSTLSGLILFETETRGAAPGYGMGAPSGLMERSTA